MHAVKPLRIVAEATQYSVDGNRQHMSSRLSAPTGVTQLRYIELIELY